MILLAIPWLLSLLYLFCHVRFWQFAWYLNASALSWLWMPAVAVFAELCRRVSQSLLQTWLPSAFTDYLSLRESSNHNFFFYLWLGNFIVKLHHTNICIFLLHPKTKKRVFTRSGHNLQYLLLIRYKRTHRLSQWESNEISSGAVLLHVLKQRGLEESRDTVTETEPVV